MKGHRLHRESDFKRLYQSGWKMRRTHLRVVWKASPMLASRWAVVVSNKISKQSTARNRIRRVLKEQLRLWARAYKGRAVDGIAVVSRFTPNTTLYSNELNECLDIIGKIIAGRP